MKMFTVIIPTLNNRSVKNNSLRCVLRALCYSAQHIAEVIVVDNGSTDGGPDIAQQAYPFPVQLLNCSNTCNRSAARNLGIEASSTPYLIFLDDDTVLSPHVLPTIIPQLRQDEFWTCAERRYVPLSMGHARLFEWISNGQWNHLADASTPLPGLHECSKPWHYALRFAFVSAFGIVPKKLVEEMGGYDESFVGWGHEDTEFMIRLLNRATLRNAFKHSVVFHIDHHISPYQWIEHDKTRQVFQRLLMKRNERFDISAFSKSIHRGQDIPRVTAIPHDDNCGHIVKHPDSRIQACLEPLLRQVLSSNNHLGLLMCGSAAYKNDFRDVDVIVVSEYGDQVFSRYREEYSNVMVEVHHLPRQHVEALHDCHLFRPHTWLLEIGKWANGVILFERDEILSSWKQSLAKWSPTRAVFAVTFFVGRLYMLAEKHTAPRRVPAWITSETYQCINGLQFVCAKRFPKSAGEYFDRIDKMHVAECLRYALQMVAEHYPSPPTNTDSEIPIYFHENAVGLDYLQDKLDGWSKCRRRSVALP